MVVLSTFLHVVLVLAFTAFVNWSPPQEPRSSFRISLQSVPLRVQNLPPVSGSKDAGPVSAPKPRKKVVKPKVEKPKPKIETPKKKVEPPKKEPVKPETTVIFPKSTPKEPEPEPEPEEKPEEVQKELENRADVFKAEDRNSGTQRYVASEGDYGAFGGPDLYRSVLVARIGQLWDPPYIFSGDVRDATVEFTIHSPPLPRGAVNQVRKSTVSDIRIAVSSGDFEYDAKALEAVRRVINWPPLPDSYRRETLTVSCRFYLIGDKQ